MFVLLVRITGASFAFLAFRDPLVDGGSECCLQGLSEEIVFYPVRINKHYRPPSLVPCFNTNYVVYRHCAVIEPRKAPMPEIQCRGSDRRQAPDRAGELIG